MTVPSGVTRASRGAWAWWWAYVVSVVVLLAVLAAAAIGGRAVWLGIVAGAVGVLGLAATVRGMWSGRGQLTDGAPPPMLMEVIRRASATERRAMLREARRGRTVSGPLAEASAWHRDHRFAVGGPLRLPFGAGLVLALAGNATAQLTIIDSDIPVLTGFFAGAAVLGLVATAWALHVYWVVLTHAARAESTNS